MSRQTQETAGLPDVPALAVTGAWETVFQGAAKAALEAALPRFLKPRRWFGAKARTIRGIRIVEAVPILQDAYLILLRADYAAGEPDTYVLPMAFMAGAAAQAFSQERPAAVIATLQAGQGSGILYDAVRNLEFCQALLEAIIQRRQYRGATGAVVATAASVLPRLRGDASQPLSPVLLGVEQSNTSVRYGEQLILKLYRRLEVGINPDQEIGQFLTERTAFANVPPVAGVLEFRRHEPVGGEPITLALLQGFVPNRGDAWHYTLDSLADYFKAARGGREDCGEPAVAPYAAAGADPRGYPGRGRAVHRRIHGISAAVGASHRRAAPGPGLRPGRSCLCPRTVHG